MSIPFFEFFWVFGLWKKQKCLKHTKVEFWVSKHCRIQEQRNKNKHEQRFFIFEKKSTILFNNATLNSILSDRNFDYWRYRPFKIDRRFEPGPNEPSWSEIYGPNSVDAGYEKFWESLERLGLVPSGPIQTEPWFPGGQWIPDIDERNKQDWTKYIRKSKYNFWKSIFLESGDYREN